MATTQQPAETPTETPVPEAVVATEAASEQVDEATTAPGPAIGLEAEVWRYGCESLLTSLILNQVDDHPDADSALGDVGLFG